MASFLLSVSAVRQSVDGRGPPIHAWPSSGALVPRPNSEAVGARLDLVEIVVEVVFEAAVLPSAKGAPDASSIHVAISPPRLDDVDDPRCQRGRQRTCPGRQLGI